MRVDRREFRIMAAQQDINELVVVGSGFDLIAAEFVDRLPAIDPRHKSRGVILAVGPMKTVYPGADPLLELADRLTDEGVIKGWDVSFDLNMMMLVV